MLRSLTGEYDRFMTYGGWLKYFKIPPHDTLAERDLTAHD
jgi:hypothetical protein